jgi:transmembrane sensor
MHDINENIRDLIVKHIRNELKPEEKDQLQQWINASGDNRRLFEDLTNLPLLYQKLNRCDQYDLEKDDVWVEIEKSLASGNRTRLSFLKGKRRWLKYAAAAAILIITMAGYLWFYKATPDKSPQQETIAKVENDVPPGQHKAMLTLSDGRKIVLDSAAQGELTQQQGIKVLNKDGQLVYDASKVSPTGGDLEGAYNTLSTTKGQMYATILSDGSRVWLNSASSVKYPVAFSGKNRSVEITGEAYFEVKHDATKPFFVIFSSPRAFGEGRKGTVEVLGTRFNINAYDDEAAVKTTLLEGSVKMASGKWRVASGSSGAYSNSEVILQPGEQAVLYRDHHSPLTINHSPNLESVLAWKEGRFYFDGADISEVMRQLERWYNIEVVYEGARPTLLFGGKMERNLNLSQVLRALEYTGIRFRIEGRKLIVMP